MTPTWSTACPDWERRIVARESMVPPPIYPETAAKAVAFFKTLRIVDLPGRPTFGECCDTWVFEFVAAIFGAYDEATGRQLIRAFYLLISKKNTKSTLAAGIMLTALRFGWRCDDEHLILAPTKEVADNSFQPAASMVRADDALAALFHVQDHIRTITRIGGLDPAGKPLPGTGATLKVVAADTDTVSGKKSGHVLVDEHWLFGKRANAERMFMEATGGLVSRDEGWVIYLSTQSDEAPAGVFREQLQYFRAVRDGRIEDKKSLGLLYEFPPAMVESRAYLQPENFYITNPNLGRSVNSEWLEDQLRRIRDRTDGSLQVFLSKHLNIEIGLALRSDRWLGADFWEACGDTALTLDALLERSEVAVVGIDGGGLDDLLGLCVMGRDRETGAWLHWAHAWAHQIALARRKEIAPTLRDFEAQGDLTVVDAPGDDVVQLAETVSRVRETGLLPEKNAIGVDPAGISAIVEELTSDARGITTEQIVAVSQGWRLNAAIKTAERRVAGGELTHGGRPLMAWCVGNAKVEPRGNAVTITKQAAGSAKIDPLMATFNAVTLLGLNPEASGHSVYETHGIRFVG